MSDRPVGRAILPAARFELASLRDFQVLETFLRDTDKLEKWIELASGVFQDRSGGGQISVAKSLPDVRRPPSKWVFARIRKPFATTRVLLTTHLLGMTTECSAGLPLRSCCSLVPMPRFLLNCVVLSLVRRREGGHREEPRFKDKIQATRRFIFSHYLRRLQSYRPMQ